MNENNQKLQCGSSVELITSGGAAILNLLATVVSPISVALTSASNVVAFGLFAYQTEQINKLINALEKRIQRLEENNLDIDFLYSDEYKALISQAIEISYNSSSDIKREKIANALVNSIILSKKNIRNKEMLLRVLSGMSDDEINMLILIYENWESCIPKRKEETTLNLLDKGDFFLGGIRESVIENLLNISQSDVRATGQGLAQLGVASYTAPDSWGLTTLGRKLIEWVIAV
jgi:hypothetical protein